MPTKEEWVKEIERLALDSLISDPRLELKSPQFVTSEWRIGVEHKRRYQSIVLRWLGLRTEQPSPLHDWRECPPSDKDRHWIFRVKLAPQGLRGFLQEIGSRPRSLDNWNAAFDERVRESSLEPDERRRERLAHATKVPRAVEVIASIFERNPDVVAEVLKRARGKCEGCQNEAPFKRKSDGSPYLLSLT